MTATSLSVVIGGILTAGSAVVVAARRARSTGLARGRLLWLAWGVVVTVATTVVGATLHLLVDRPDAPFTWLAVGIVVIPLSMLVGRAPAAAKIAERVVVSTVVVVGLVALTGAVYVFVVLGLGRAPEEGERSLLVLSMTAAALACLLAVPARRRLEERTNQLVYGERHSPDEALRTFGGRMTRSVPMDELMLQLVETLRATMRLQQAEVWTGDHGRLTRAVSVPDRGPARLELQGDELSVVARGHAQGNAWLAMWAPALLEGRDDRLVRSVSVTHLGELLGLIVLERRADEVPFTEEEDRVLVDLARQVGLALHNVQLDSALQASLDELEVRNAELEASRARIVAAADESRRTIERNLHDGAQQHLVALAVKVGLIRTLMGADPDTAASMVEELRGDVQATLTELRELAHGIYPPLLRDRGLGEALRAAANRSTLPTSVDVEIEDRFATDVEAAVYFCCLEAMQNAGKYAGESAAVCVRVRLEDDVLFFAVSDDGVGFDVGGAVDGHGFVNMTDRLGALGGELQLITSPGGGATVSGRVPVRSSA